MSSAHQILGLDPGCSKEDARRAFHKKAFRTHPDRNRGSAEAARRFTEVKEAYQSIINQDTLVVAECRPVEPKKSVVADAAELIKIRLSQVFTGTAVPVRTDGGVVYVSVPKGVDDDEVLPVGDGTHVRVKLVESDGFERQGLDLVYSARISLREALTGFRITIPHPSGTPIYLTSDGGNVVNPRTRHKCHGLGIPRDTVVGDLYVTFDIDFPPTLSSEAEELVRLHL